MMESSFTILGVRGIPIGAHWSWPLVFALVVGSVLFPATYPGLDGATYLAMAGWRRCCSSPRCSPTSSGMRCGPVRECERIDGITLWLFGGVARIRG